MGCFELWALKGDLQPGCSQFSAGCWAQHRAGAAAALGQEHNHLFPSPARSASQAANWDNSPHHKQLDKRLCPPWEGGREGGKQGRSKHSEYLPTTSRTDTTQLPVLTTIGASLILSLQKQQIPRKDFPGSPSSSTHLPISAPCSSLRHSRSYSSCTHLWLQTAASRSADSVNLCHLLPCLPGQLQ